MIMLNIVIIVLFSIEDGMIVVKVVIFGKRLNSIKSMFVILMIVFFLIFVSCMSFMFWE